MLADASRARAAVRGLWNGGAARAFASALDAFDPARTIVHLHGWMKALSSSVVRVARDRGFRIVSTRSEEHTSELQSLMRNSYAVFCLKKNTKTDPKQTVTKPQPQYPTST